MNVKCPKIKVKEIENPQKMREGNRAGCLIAHKTKPTWSGAVWPDVEFQLEAFKDHAWTKTSVTDTENQSLMGDARR